MPPKKKASPKASPKTSPKLSPASAKKPSPKIRPRQEEQEEKGGDNNKIEIVLPGAHLAQNVNNTLLQDETVKSAAAKGFRSLGGGDSSVTATIAGFIKKNTSTSSSTKQQQHEDAAAASTTESSSSLLLPQIYPLTASVNQKDEDRNETSDSNQQQQQQQQTVAAPQPGATVLFRVTKVHTIGVSGPIVAINNKWCMMSGSSSSFKGFVRLDDIRSVTAKEVAAGLVPTHAADSYRLGDLVCADVISLTEARQFQLTTTPAHCGMVKCFSERKLDGVYKYVDAKRRDAGVIVVDEQTGTEKQVSRWVPDYRTTKEYNSNHVNE